MSSKVGILAHYQPVETRPGTHLSTAMADLLVQRMVAERISQKLIRMLPPDSVFAAAKVRPEIMHYIPTKLPPREVENCKFKLPITANTSTVPRSQFLGRRRELYGDLQLAISLLPASDSCLASSTT